MISSPSFPLPLPLPLPLPDAKVRNMKDVVQMSYEICCIINGKRKWMVITATDIKVTLT